MASPPHTRGEQWSSTYRNPTWRLERDQENTAMLVGDIRRTVRITLIGVALLATVLAISGSPGAGLNLALIGGGPVLIIAAMGKLLGRWARRHHTVP